MFSKFRCADFYAYIRSMLSVCLNALQFKAFHGLYDEEKVNGNDFEVNVKVSYQPSSLVQSIHQTINYEIVFKIIAARMEIATPLLETITIDITNEIFSTFTAAEEVFVSITKLHPPIKNLIGTVGVEYILNRKDWA
jgi:dihydroneopterin aldolase